MCKNEKGPLSPLCIIVLSQLIDLTVITVTDCHHLNENASTYSVNPGDSNDLKEARDFT